MNFWLILGTLVFSGTALGAIDSTVDAGIGIFSHPINVPGSQNIPISGTFGTTYYDFYLGTKMRFGHIVEYEAPNGEKLDRSQAEKYQIQSLQRPEMPRPKIKRIVHASRFGFAPMLFYMPNFLLPTKSVDGQVETTYTILNLPATFDCGYGFNLKSGFALMDYQLQTSGSPQTLGNGTGTKVFITPSQTRHARTIAVELGGAYEVKNINIGLETFIEGFLSNSRRTYSLMLTVGYSFWSY